MRPFTRLAAATMYLALAAACSKDPQVLRKEFIQSGDQSMKDGKLSEAVIQYRNAVAADGVSGEARFKLGEAYERNGDLRDALREYVRAADLMRDDVEAQVRAGNALLLAGQFPEARARANAALEKEPRNVRALIILGNSMAGMKDMKNAITTVQQAVDANPTELLAYTNLGALQLAQGDRAAAEQAFKRAVEINPKSEDARLALANFYWAANRTREAETELKAALQTNPKSLMANRALAVFLGGVGRAQESEPYLKAYADLSSEPGPKLSLADYFILQNRRAEAVGVLENVEKVPTGWAEARMRMAALAFTDGRSAEAHTVIDEVLKREPAKNDAHVEKARFFLLEGKPTEALALADAVISRDPKSASAHYVRGTALKTLGSLDGAVRAFEETVKLSPTETAPVLQLAELYLAKGDGADAARFASQVLRRTPGDGMAHLLLAKALILQNNLRAAELEVRGLLAGSPKSADVQALVGDFQLAKGDLNAAQTAFEKALSIDERSMGAITGMIKVEISQKRFDSARARLAILRQKYPKNANVVSLTGSALMDMGDVGAAEAAFRSLMELEPSNFKAYAALGGIYVGQKRLDEARKQYDEVARLNPAAAPAALTMAGTIVQLQGKPDEARQYFQKALELDPQMPIAANNLAWDYAERGENLDVALNLAQMAKSKIPESAIINDTIGWVYYKKGLASLAITAFDEALKASPNDAGIFYRQGLAHLLNNDKTRAQRSLEKALSLDPQFPQAEEARRALEKARS